ncbi:hypothetical protein ECTW09098_2388, partial [Escherichia coli TW09098]
MASPLADWFYLCPDVLHV